MPYKEKEILKQYYSISEVAEMFNVNQSTLRFWEKEFDNVNPKKNRKGNRLFSLKDIEALKIIYHLVKDRGFTLEGARKQIKNNKKSDFYLISQTELLQEIYSGQKVLKKIEQKS